MSALVKTSVTVPADLLDRARRAGMNVSQVTRTALERALREAEFETLVEQYDRAFDEWEASGDAADWDRTAADGLDDEG
jgi:post-segregation antitoxin (ccd killing protein)